jgi:hypothetical protein
MSLLAELEEFVHDHRPHGPLTADATEPAWNGYLVTVACPCGVVFGRWVTPEEAEADRFCDARLSTFAVWSDNPTSPNGMGSRR